MLLQSREVGDGKIQKGRVISSSWGRVVNNVKEAAKFSSAEMLWVGEQTTPLTVEQSETNTERED